MIKEPVLHFALLGGVIFLIHLWWSPPPATTIRVTPQIVQDLVSEREDILGRKIQTEERKQLVENYIDQQVLVAEAIKLGLDKTDTRITNLLADRMKGLLAEEIADPTEAQIDSLYHQGTDRYRSPDLISFEHVYYSSDTLDRGDYAKILAQLESDAIRDQFGHRFWLGSSMEGYSRDALATMLGADFTSQIFELDRGKWFGPIKSTRGIHLVRVNEKSEGRTLPLERARQLVIQDWRRMQREIVLKRRIDQMREAYTVELDLEVPD